MKLDFSQISMGDLNNDGSIDILDVIIILNAILLGEYNIAGDMNYDGVLNVMDVVIVVNTGKSADRYDGECWHSRSFRRWYGTSLRANQAVMFSAPVGLKVERRLFLERALVQIAIKNIHFMIKFHMKNNSRIADEQPK